MIMAKVTTTEKGHAGHHKLLYKLQQCTKQNKCHERGITTGIYITDTGCLHRHFLYLYDVSKNKLVEHFGMCRAFFGYVAVRCKKQQVKLQTLIHTCIKIYFFKELNFYLLDIFD